MKVFVNQMVSMARRFIPAAQTIPIDSLILDASIRTGQNKRFFLKFVDKSKPHIYKAFASEYAEPYAKLLTLKTVNLIVSKYHFINNHTTVASRPIQFMVDPSNACQLTCPGCVHTSNPTWAAEAAIHWPKGMLSEDYYKKFLKSYGPFAFGAVFFNYGEPLLNPMTPLFISMARKYLLFTYLSSNLSLPIIDADAIVKSGLNHMIISIDGVTQKVYEQFRRGGKLNLVLENVRKLVDAKKRLRLKTPYLVWQFLTFEHNLHEVDSALAMAESIGVDAIQILTPYDVSADVPTVRVTKSSKEGYHFFTQWHSRIDYMDETDPDLSIGPEIDAFLKESLVKRMRRIGNIDEDSHGGASSCGWLYKNITLDGLGRIMPCCTSPGNQRHLVFGYLNDVQGDYWNSNDYEMSRLAFSNRNMFDQSPKENLSHCTKCLPSDHITHGLWRIAEDLPFLDKSEVLSADVKNWLTNWS